MFNWLVGKKKRAEEAAVASEAVTQTVVKEVAVAIQGEVPAETEASAGPLAATEPAAWDAREVVMAADAAREGGPKTDFESAADDTSAQKAAFAAAQAAAKAAAPPSGHAGGATPEAEMAAAPSSDGEDAELEAKPSAAGDGTYGLRVGGPLPGVSIARNKPFAGMSATLFAGRKLQPVKVVDVSASGRRILVSSPGSSLRRPYTLRKDGSYRLEGAPDGNGPFVELS